MINIYILYIRSVLESSAVVWHSSITLAEQLKIEQLKVALTIILNDDYEDYGHTLELKCFSDRRETLCKKFANNCIRNKKTCHMFPLKSQYCQHYTNWEILCANRTTGRVTDPTIPFMRRLLNVTICAIKLENSFKQWIIINCIPVSN